MAPGVRVRAALRWLHRWIGLTLGLVFVVVTLSGASLLFQPQFFEWVHGEMIPDDLSPEIGSIDQWVQKARAAVPQLHGPTFIWAPHVEHNVSDAGMLMFEGLEPGGFGNTGLAAVLVAPATGEVLGVVESDHSPAYAPIFLHRDLWSGEIGALLSAIMAVGIICMLPVGLYLWWPARGRLLQKLSPRPWRTTLTRAARLHDWAGAWSVLLLLLLTVTGLYIVRPEWVEPALSVVPGAAEHGHVDAAAGACTGAMGFDTALARAGALVPGGTPISMTAEDTALRTWEVAFRTGDGDALYQETHVLADLECGIVELEATPESRAPRDSLDAWLMGLHDGTAFGMPGEILVSLMGVVPLVLMWSGIRMWLRRRGWLGAQRKARYGEPAMSADRS